MLKIKFFNLNTIRSYLSVSRINKSIKVIFKTINIVLFGINIDCLFNSFYPNSFLVNASFYFVLFSQCFFFILIWMPSIHLYFWHLHNTSFTLFQLNPAGLIVIVLAWETRYVINCFNFELADRTFSRSVHHKEKGAVVWFPTKKPSKAY